MAEPGGNILLVDDDEVFARVFGEELTRMGYTVHLGYGGEVHALVTKHKIDIAILDIVMPEPNGLELLKQLKAREPGCEVIMLTGNATVENALTSMKLGAYDYFTKPVARERVEEILRRCMGKRRLAEKNQMLKEQLSDLREGQLIGDSTAMREIQSLIVRFAEADSTVLIQGESGTGKELVANLIHRNSPRALEPFIIVDCSALKESLLESELFGHERGAFTGAITRKHGIFEIADGGTIFLDEIGDISLALQVKLLRVVETRSFRRVGGNQRIKVDVRLIAATNRDLREMVREREFREDLYYRVNVVSISIPPLREHPEDIPELVGRFLAELPATRHRPQHFSTEALSALQKHDWPGNIRELRNLVERSILLAEGDIIELKELPLAASPLKSILDSFGSSGYPSLKAVQDEYIKWVLEKTQGNKKLAAKILKVDRKTVLRHVGRDDNEE